MEWCSVWVVIRSERQYIVVIIMVPFAGCAIFCWWLVSVSSDEQNLWFTISYFAVWREMWRNLVRVMTRFWLNQLFVISMYKWRARVEKSNGELCIRLIIAWLHWAGQIELESGRSREKRKSLQLIHCVPSWRKGFCTRERKIVLVFWLSKHACYRSPALLPLRFNDVAVINPLAAKNIKKEIH
jgi:hypothetical protein